MEDAKLELRLLQYLNFDAKGVFERTDSGFFYSADYRKVYEEFSKYFFTFGNLPHRSSYHSLFHDRQLRSIAGKILLNNSDEFENSELEFLIDRLAELKITRSLKPFVLDAVDEISSGHGFEALEILENGTMEVARGLRRSNRVDDDIDGDVKMSLFIREENLSKSSEFDLLQIGFPGFDAEIGGVRRGQLVLFCSPTGQGKSITLLNIGGNLYRQGFNVIYALLEMERSEWEMRFDSWLTGIEFGKFYNHALSPEEWNIYKISHINSLLDSEGNEDFLEWLKSDGIEELKKITIREFTHRFMKECKFRQNIFYPLDIPRSCTIEKLEIRMNYVRQKWGCDALIIDYPGIMEYGHSRDSNWKDLDELFKELKGMARFYRIPVLCAGQLHDEEISSLERMTSRWVRFSKSILDHTDLSMGWVRSMEDIRNKRIRMKTLKTRNCRHNFEIRCHADFDRMKIEEEEFRILE